MDCINSIVTGYPEDVVNGATENEEIPFNYRFISSILRTPKVEDAEHVIDVIFENVEDTASIQGEKHFKLVDVLTATENIILGLKEKGRLDLKAASERIRKICDDYGFELNPDQKIYDMSVSQKQTVEIVKVLYRGANILILDEPTAVLTPQETDKLFTIIHNMKSDGKAIVIITHKLNEVKRIYRRCPDKGHFDSANDRSDGRT